MRSHSAIVVCALAVSACEQVAPRAPRLTYPVAAKDGVIDDYAGHKVPDSYRWMEALDNLSQPSSTVPA